MKPKFQNKGKFRKKISKFWKYERALKVWNIKKVTNLSLVKTKNYSILIFFIPRIKI